MTHRSFRSRVRSAVGCTLALACAAALAPTQAFAMEADSSTAGVVGDVEINGDSYSKVVFAGGIGWGPTRIDALCPSDFPYLDGTQGTPGLSVGRGLVVWVDKGLTIVEDPFARIEEYISSREVRYKGTTVVPWNHTFDGRGVSVTMFCTSSKAKAWTDQLYP